jgi:hypothetical protein
MESPKGWLGGLIETLYLIIVYSFGMKTSIRIIFCASSCLFQLSQKHPHFPPEDWVRYSRHRNRKNNIRGRERGDSGCRWEILIINRRMI